MPDTRRRALILAGGGVKVAFQAGVLQVWLDEAGIDFAHADGASGGVLNGAMWAQGYTGTQIADRWRNYKPLRGIQPNVRGWLRGESLFRLERFRRTVLQETFGLDWPAIQTTDREVTFNCYDFTRHRLDVRAAADMDEDLLVSAVSLPMWFPAVPYHGRRYIDAVFATDANLDEAIRRGADDLWIIWTVSQRGQWRDGFINQYFQVIEAAANANLRAILRRIKENNDAVDQSKHAEFGRRIDVHVLEAEVPVHYLLNFTQDRIRAAVELGVTAARRWCAERGIQTQPVPRRPRSAIPIRIKFTEVMTGHVAFGEADYDRGARAGRDLATSLRFRLTIAVEDLDHFVADPDAGAIAVGFVSGSAVGGRRPVERGRFQLLLYDRDPRDRRMRYELWFSDHAGHQLTLAGFKVVHDEPGFDAWRDTTVLHTRLLAGHVDGDDPDASVVASGILVITPAAFARQLTTFRASADSFRSAAVGLYRFVRLFFGRLWDVYAAPASVAQPAAGVRSGARGAQ